MRCNYNDICLKNATPDEGNLCQCFKMFKLLLKHLWFHCRYKSNKDYSNSSLGKTLDTFGKQYCPRPVLSKACITTYITNL